MTRDVMGWLDTRLHEPSSNHADRYMVLFRSNGLVFLGIARWMPYGHYKAGRWERTECTNGNPLDGEVLYWMKHPSKEAFK